PAVSPTAPCAYLPRLRGQSPRREGISVRCARRPGVARRGPRRPPSMTLCSSPRCGRVARTGQEATTREVPMAQLLINDRTYTVDADPSTPLLWVIRERLQLTGTKFGCGIAQCGACTIRLDGAAARSCQTTVAQAAGKKITTIEGLHPKGEHQIGRAHVAEQVPQCGYCQSGQIMQAAALLAK